MRSSSNNWKKPQVHRPFSRWRSLTIPDTCRKDKTEVLKQPIRNQRNLSALITISKELSYTRYLQKKKELTKDRKTGGRLHWYEMVRFRILGGEEETRRRTILLDFRRWDILFYRDLLERIPQNMIWERKVVEVSWLIFKNHPLQAKRRSIPINQKPSRGL